jgi:hypothetical protein
MAQNRPYTNQVRNAGNTTLDLLLYVAANGVSALSLANSSANINFNNTASVSVAISANGNNQTNVAFSVNGAVLNVSSANVSNIVIGGNSTNVTIDTRLAGSSGNGVLTGPSWFQVGPWMHQWGESSPGGGSPQMVTFPEPFPNACQAVICIPFALNETIWVLNVSPTAFNVSVGATGQAFMWMADGH